MNSFEVVVEISKNSKLKWELDKKTNKLTLDRILHGSNTYPQNYGYLENTLDEDGDPLDVLIISEHSLIPNSVVPVRIIGGLKMIDSGERDSKLIGVISVDPRYSNIQEIKDIDKNILLEIEDFFNNYKNLENKTVKTDGFVDRDGAISMIEEGKKLYSSKK